MNLRNKVALVTGAGAGIGRAIAIRLANAGAAVVVDDIDAAGGRETVRLVEASGARAIYVEADVGEESQIRTMIAAAESFGGVDVLVNNAGVVEALTTQRNSFPAVEPMRWTRMLDVNLRGVVLATQFAVAAMRARGGGVIVNIASGAGIGYGPHDAPVYAAAKAAVVRFSAALAPLKDEMNIRVNCVCPGWVDTPMSQRARAETPVDEWRQIAPAVMLRPADIADAVAQFVNDDSLAGRVMLAWGPKPWPLLSPAANP